MNIFGSELPDEIEVKIERNGNTLRGSAKTAKYVVAKTNQLREFGYNDLPLDTVADELRKIIHGENVTVIGMMMEDEVITRHK